VEVAEGVKAADMGGVILRRMRTHLFHCLLFPLVLLLAASPAMGQEKPWQFPDPEGQMHEPLKAGDKKGVILFFVSPYCPTANTLMPEINAIAKDHAADFASYIVHADPSIKVTDAYQHAVLFKVESAKVLLDTEQRLAKRVQARITPEAVVLGPDEKVLYQGRINDLYLGATKRQRKATTQDLRDALQAIQAGKAVAASRTEAVGCKISGME
jgi:thiol-disulfide isomerase/thioredoxin